MKKYILVLLSLGALTIAACSKKNKSTATCHPGGYSPTALSLTGTVSTLATNISNMYGMTSDGTYLYVVAGTTILKVEIATGTVTTLSSSGWNQPIGITTDCTNLYVTDSGGPSFIASISMATGVVTKIITSGLSNPLDITTDGTNLYFIDSNIQKVVISTLAISTFVSSSNYTAPLSLTNDGTYLYLTDYTGGGGSGGKIHKVSLSSGAITTISSSGWDFGSLYNFMTTDGINIYVSDSNVGSVSRLSNSGGTATNLAASAGMNGSEGVATDGQYLYVVDRGNSKIDIIK